MNHAVGKLRLTLTMRFLAAFLLATQLFAQTPANPPDAKAQPAPSNPAVENARKAQGVIRKTIIALGGDAYLKVFDLKQEGRGFGFSKGASTGVGAPFVRYYQYPDKERWEYFKDGEWVIIRVGDQGYDTTWRGTREEDPQSLAAYNRRRQYALDRVLRQWAFDPKTAFFYDGQTMMDTKQVHKIVMVSPENLSVILYIDVRTDLPVRKSYSFRDEYRDLKEESELFDMYRVIQGINTPFRYTRMLGADITSQIFMKVVSYNVGAGDAIFKPKEINYNKLKR